METNSDKRVLRVAAEIREVFDDVQEPHFVVHGVVVDLANSARPVMARDHTDSRFASNNPVAAFSCHATRALAELGKVGMEDAHTDGSNTRPSQVQGKPRGAWFAGRSAALHALEEAAQVQS